MIEIKGDLWEVEGDARVVTTNGIVKSNGELVMGGGCALEAALRYPDMPKRLGYLVQHWGNHSYILTEADDQLIMSMPTKNDYRDPSDMDLIIRSAKELVMHANDYHLTQVIVPRPGCGLGGLNWDDVKIALTPIFDQRFHIVSY